MLNSKLRKKIGSRGRKIIQDIIDSVKITRKYENYILKHQINFKNLDIKIYF